MADLIKKTKIYFTCLINGHKYWMYYKSKFGGEEIWYCKTCMKQKVKF